MRYLKIGNITIGQGSKYIFNALSGFDIGDIEHATSEYTDVDGADITGSYFSPRNIEISGAILAETREELETLKRSLVKACTPKKDIDLYYNNEVKTYYCKARGNGLPAFGVKPSRNSYYVSFIIYLVVPGFYWQSESDIQTDLFTTIPLLNKNTVLPAIFSTRSSRSTIINDGDVPTYAQILIYCDKPNTLPIVIKNMTTGKNITLNYTMSAKEIIKLDMEFVKAISSINGNIINDVDRNSDFFEFVEGDNVISCETDNLYIVSYHRNRYMGV